MQKKTAALVTFALLLLSGVALVLVTGLTGGDEIPTVRWSLADAVEVEDPPDAATAEGGPEDTQRTVVDTEAPPPDTGRRVDATLHGRVVDPFARPVANARVFLDFRRGGRGGGRGGRGGRSWRIPEPVITGRDGTFAFAGEVFASVTLGLRVVHGDFAPTLEQRNLTDVQEKLDLGDIVVNPGALALGRVTDEAGNGIPSATVEIEPQNNNPLRWQRDWRELLPAQETDRNGFYRIVHLPAGDFRIRARAPRHQRGGSPTFSLAEGEQRELEDIRLGPGYELVGTVYGPDGSAIASARVTATNQGRGPRDFRERTDEEGRFQIDHLPGSKFELRVEAKGFLNHKQPDVDPVTSGPLIIQLETGLRITGSVTDAVSGAAVTRFAVRERRLRGLPKSPRGTAADMARLQELQQRLEQVARGGNREAMLREVRQLRGRMQNFNVTVRASPRSTNVFRSGRAGDVREHPDGTFEIGGLQEGVYVVDLESPDHQRYRSEEFELAPGRPAPHLQVGLSRGLTVSGTVLDSGDRPIPGAQVELRTVPGPDSERSRGRGGRRGRSFGGAVVVSAKTDVRGRYVLEHAPAGRFSVRARADKMTTVTSDPFDLAADLAGVVLQLAGLGSLTGYVQGLPAGRETEARVIALSAKGGLSGFGGRSRPIANVAQDGSYRIEGLEPGGYLVRAYVGSAAQLFRSDLVAAMSQGTAAPDVMIRGGETVEFDVVLPPSDTGTVTGTVSHNYQPAQGFRVQLARTGGNEIPGGNRWTRMGRNFTATVDGDGAFELRDVPNGSYDLSVTADRRSAVLHRQQLLVAAEVESTVAIDVLTGGIEGTVKASDDTPTDSLDGNAMLLAGVNALPQDLAAWRRENTAHNLRVRDGSFRGERLGSGNYLLVLDLRGRKRVTQQVYLSPGSTTRVTVQAGQ